MHIARCGILGPPRRLSRFESDLRWSADSLGTGVELGGAVTRPSSVRMHICVKLERQAERAKWEGGRRRRRGGNQRERGWEANLGMKDDGRGSWRSGKQTEKSVETDPEGKE